MVGFLMLLQLCTLFGEVNHFHIWWCCYELCNLLYCCWNRKKYLEIEKNTWK